MMIQANILPLEYRRRTRQQRRFRLWLMSAVTVGILHLVFGTVVGYMARHTRHARSEIAHLQAQQQIHSKELALLTVEEKTLAGRLQLSESLRRKHRWSEILSSLVDRLPENVVLTKLETDPPRSEPLGTRTGTSKKKPNAPSIAKGQPNPSAKGLTIQGVALDHESIATFLRAVNADSSIGYCQLQSTARQAFRSGQGVAFTAYIGW